MIEQRFEFGEGKVGGDSEGYRNGAPLESELVAADQRDDAHHQRSNHDITEAELPPGNTEGAKKVGTECAHAPCSEDCLYGDEDAEPDVNGEKLREGVEGEQGVD